MSSSTTNQFTPKRTIVHYKYRLFLELGLDPYEVPEKVTYDYDTWSQVCQGIFTHLGQSMDKSDNSIRHCGKWYVTNHGRGKILQVVDFYEYEYDSDTEREIQQTENKNAAISNKANSSIKELSVDPSRFRLVHPPRDNDNDKESSDSYSESSDSDCEVEALQTLIKNAGPQEFRETVKKCVDEIMSCNIL